MTPREAGYKFSGAGPLRNLYFSECALVTKFLRFWSSLPTPQPYSQTPCNFQCMILPEGGVSRNTHMTLQ